MLDEILARVDQGRRDTHVAAIIDQGVLRTRGMSNDKVEEWRDRQPTGRQQRICVAGTSMFPIRVPLVPSRRCEEPIGYLLVGPRPDGSIPSRDEQKALRGSRRIDRPRHPDRDQARGARAAARIAD